MSAFERLVHKAMRQMGWLLPTTVEDVRAAEEYQAAHPVQLPDRLRKPPELPGERPEAQARQAAKE